MPSPVENSTAACSLRVATLDIGANRRAKKYSWLEILRRMAWGVGRWFFRLSPRPCFAWRRFVLRCFGARVGANVNTYPSVWVYFPWNLTIGDWSAIGEHAFIYNLGPVRIGERATISHRAQLCAGTHDYTQPDMPLLRPPIVIQDQVWVCANAFVGPGVTVGEGAIIGACAVATRNVEPWTIVAGNPAKSIKRRELKSADTMDESSVSTHPENSGPAPAPAIRLAIAGLGILGVGLAIFLSVKTPPTMITVWWLPGFLATWADHHGRLCNLPAYAFVALPFLTIASGKRQRARVVALLTALIILLEVVQLWIPARTTDGWDVFWGGAGILLSWAAVEMATLILRPSANRKVNLNIPCPSDSTCQS